MIDFPKSGHIYISIWLVAIAIMHSIYILAMKTDIIIARTGNKRGYYLTVCIAFCDYIANSSYVPCLMLTQQVKILPSSA